MSVPLFRTPTIQCTARIQPHPMYSEHSIKSSHLPRPVPHLKPSVPNSPTQQWPTHSATNEFVMAYTILIWEKLSVDNVERLNVDDSSAHETPVETPAKDTGNVTHGKFDTLPFSSWSSSPICCAFVPLLLILWLVSSSVISPLRSHVFPSSLPHFNHGRVLWLMSESRRPSFHLPGTTNFYNNYTRAKLTPGSTTGPVPKTHHPDGVAGCPWQGQTKALCHPDFQHFLGLHHAPSSVLSWLAVGWAIVTLSWSSRFSCTCKLFTSS